MIVATRAYHDLDGHCAWHNMIQFIYVVDGVPRNLGHVMTVWKIRSDSPVLVYDTGGTITLHTTSRNLMDVAGELGDYYSWKTGRSVVIGEPSYVIPDSGVSSKPRRAIAVAAQPTPAPTVEPREALKRLDYGTTEAERQAAAAAANLTVWQKANAVTWADVGKVVSDIVTACGGIVMILVFGALFWAIKKTCHVRIWPPYFFALPIDLIEIIVVKYIRNRRAAKL
jgi:hypothetical protein